MSPLILLHEGHDGVLNRSLERCLYVGIPEPSTLKLLGCPLQLEDSRQHIIALGYMSLMDVG